jgi:hypothetical protein
MSVERDPVRGALALLHDAPPPAELATRIKAGVRGSARRSTDRRRWAVGLAAGVAIALAGAWVGLRATQGPVSATRPPVASASASTASGGPSAEASESSSPSSLVEGGLARATRDVTIAPGIKVLAGQTVLVVAGPIDHSDSPSYRVQAYGDLTNGYRPAGVLGWLTAEVATDALVPRDPNCPDGSPDIAGISAIWPFERLLCFGSRDLTFGPVTPSTVVYGGGLSDRWLSADGNPDFLTGLPYVLPAGVPDIADGAWVTVTGHFDDPTAASCGEPGLVAFCREQFHLSTVTSVAPPGFVLPGSWQPTRLPPIDGRSNHAMAWTGTEAVIWGGISSSSDPKHSVFDGVMPRNGAAYDPATDRWRTIPNAPIPGRITPLVVWTGHEVVVFGGQIGEQSRLDGAAWNPATNRWRTIARAPLTGSEAVGAWLDGRLYVVTSAGAASYDPGNDSWTALPEAPIRPGWRTAAVAAGRLFVVAYGDGATPPVEWAVLDPATGAWHHGLVPLEPATAGVTFVGAGDRVGVPDAGVTFDPLTETWGTTKRCDGASGGTVWTGRYLLGVAAAWDSRGGGNCFQLPPSPKREPPFDDTNGREFAVAVWTGQQYITWSGGTGGDIVWVPKDGAVFTPKDDLGPGGAP